jgi:hypothetical protein
MGIASAIRGFGDFLNRPGINQHLTSLPALGPCSPGGPRVSLRSHGARSAQPHCPRQRTRVNPVRGLALSARATSQAGDRYVKLGQGTTEHKDEH